jgi:hypothetical protein
VVVVAAVLVPVRDYQYKERFPESTITAATPKYMTIMTTIRLFMLALTLSLTDVTCKRKKGRRRRVRPGPRRRNHLGNPMRV